MQQFSLFQQIQKPVIDKINEVTTVLEQPVNDENVHYQMLQVLQLSSLISYYLRYVDVYLLAAIDAYEPSVTDAIRQDQCVAKRKLKNLKLALIDFNKSESIIRDSNNNFYKSFKSVCSFVLYLMGKEGTVVPPILDQYYTVKELKSFEDLIIQKSIFEPAVLVA